MNEEGRQQPLSSLGAGGKEERECVDPGIMCRVYSVAFSYSNRRSGIAPTLRPAYPVTTHRASEDTEKQLEGGCSEGRLCAVGMADPGPAEDRPRLCLASLPETGTCVPARRQAGANTQLRWTDVQWAKTHLELRIQITCVRVNKIS